MNRHVIVICIAALAAVVPPTYMLASKWDVLQERMTVDPRTAKGHIIYFTAPS